MVWEIHKRRNISYLRRLLALLEKRKIEIGLGFVCKLLEWIWDAAAPTWLRAVMVSQLGICGEGG